MNENHLIENFVCFTFIALPRIPGIYILNVTLNIELTLDSLNGVREKLVRGQQRE